MISIASLAPLGCPKNVHPHEWRQYVATRIDTLAGQMNALIEALDQMDGDPDFELQGDEEPSLGWPLGHGMAQFGREPQGLLGDDREQDDADWEPSLAAPEREGRQINWAAGSDGDGEDADADLEPGPDAEPANLFVTGGGSGI